MPKNNSREPVSVRSEFEGADLGDLRRDKRLERISSAIAVNPSRSLPETFGKGAELEATYRFLGNDSVGFEDILAPHFAKTVKRAESSAGVIIAAHDTSEIKFGGEFPREGLGWLRHGRQGYLAHCSMLVALEGPTRHRVPLGVLNIKAIFQAWDEEKRKEEAPQNERWLSGIQAVEERLPQKVDVIHTADREIDSFHLLADLKGAALRFVIRVQFDRRVEGGKMLLASIADQPRIALRRKVQICSRKPAELPGATSTTGRPALARAATGRPASNKKKHPARLERDADLVVSVGKHQLLRPDSDKTTKVDRIDINVVRVFEPNPPPDCHPVDWMLFTSEPVGTLSEVATVIDVYRARWVIEEFFKALKTGCSYEKLQLEGRGSLLNALAVYTPIAWVLLRLRSSAQNPEDEDARDVLSDEQIEILRVLYPKLAPNPTLKQALYAIAGLGGHLKNNGDPGWQTVGRGMRRLLETEATLHLFRRKK